MLSILLLQHDEDGSVSASLVIEVERMLCVCTPITSYKLPRSMHEDQGVPHRLCQAYRSPITGKLPSHAEHQKSEGGLKISDAAIRMDITAAHQGETQTAPIHGMQQVLAKRMQGCVTAGHQHLSALGQALTACRKR